MYLVVHVAVHWPFAGSEASPRKQRQPHLFGGGVRGAGTTGNNRGLDEPAAGGSTTIIVYGETGGFPGGMFAILFVSMATFVLFVARFVWRRVHGSPTTVTRNVRGVPYR